MSEKRKIQARQWAQRMITTDIESRWTVQREIYVKEEAQALSKSLLLTKDEQPLEDNTKCASQLRAYEEEIDQLNSQNWENFRQRGEVEGNTPHGCTGRALKSYKANPDWYLNKLLRED